MLKTKLLALSTILARSDGTWDSWKVFWVKNKLFSIKYSQAIRQYPNGVLHSIMLVIQLSIWMWSVYNSKKLYFDPLILYIKKLLTHFTTCNPSIFLFNILLFLKYTIDRVRVEPKYNHQKPERKLYHTTSAWFHY